MSRQPDAEPVVPSVPASRISAAGAPPLDPRVAADPLRQSLGQDRVGITVSLLHGMLAADRGAGLARAPRNERRLLVALLPANE